MSEEPDELDPARTAGKSWRPCCGTCRMTGLIRTETGWECIVCELPWDGSEVNADRLPELLEQQIAGGYCTRQQAYEAFLRMDDLAQAAADEQITVAHGAELVVLDALAVTGKERPQ